MSGSTPRRFSSRNSRSAMLVTIWMWIQEWSDMPSRSAFTCADVPPRLQLVVGVGGLEQRLEAAVAARRGP